MTACVGVGSVSATRADLLLVGDGWDGAACVVSGGGGVNDRVSATIGPVSGTWVGRLVAAPLALIRAGREAQLTSFSLPQTTCDYRVEVLFNTPFLKGMPDHTPRSEM